MRNAPPQFSALARRSSAPPISWLMTLALERPGLISLAAGFTDNATLPVAEVAQLTRAILAHPRTARAALQYGTTIGLPELRHQILRRWQRQEQIVSHYSRITSDHVVVTNGSQQLLYLVSEVLCDPGDIVIVEDPTYFVYLGIVEALGLRPVGFDSLENLKSKLEQLRRRRLLPRLKLLYLVTYFQNPTGHTWPLAAKRELLAIVKHYERAAGHRIYILEDAAYRDLRFAGLDVPSFPSLARRDDRIVYAGTLTKPFATGLKIGYGILPPALGQAVLRAKGNHDFGSANFCQTILARALAEGLYERHLARLAAAYCRKRDAMIEALGKVGPASCLFSRRPGTGGMPVLRYDKPQGGLYVWVTVESGLNTGANGRLFHRALDAGVLYVPGAMCFCRDPSRPIPDHHLRLSFGAPTVAQIHQGIGLLGRVIATANGGVTKPRPAPDQR